MDDTEYVLAIQGFIQKYGFLHGIWERFLQHMHHDFYTGILRPSFWVHTATIYLLPPNWAYTARFVQFLLVQFFVADAFLRMAGKTLLRPSFLNRAEKISVVFLLSGLLSVRAIYDGVAMVSLQEFSGIFFLAIALWFLSFRGLEALALMAMYFGAGFKPPFVWLFLFMGFYFWFEKQRAKAALCFVSYLGIFSWSVYLAKYGFYSNDIYKMSWYNYIATLSSGLKHGAAPFLVLCAAGLFWGRRNWQEIFRGKQWKLGAVFFLSGAMYFATLLPRGVMKGYGYYLSAPLFFLVVGAFFFLQSRESSPDTTPAQPTILKKMSVLAAISIAAVVFCFGFWKLWERNFSVIQVRDWALALPMEERFLATNSGEVNFRLAEILSIRSGGTWNGKVVALMDRDEKIPDAKYYVVFKDQVPPKKEAMKELVWSRGSVQVFQMR